MIENIHSVCINTAYVCAAGVGAVVVAYGAVRGMKFLSGGVKCLAAASLAGSLIIGGMVVTSVHVAGAKTNDTLQVGGDLSNTNDVGQVEGGTNVLTGVQGRARSPSAPQGAANGESNVPALRRSQSLRPTGMAPVTDEDIARRWRVVSVSSNSVDASVFAFEQSNNQTIEQSPVVWEAAQRRGAVFGAWRVPLEGWQFPFDDYGWSNAFMRCEGVLRDSFRDASDQIRFLSPFALCPAAHWSRYGLAASRAWSATNEFGGLTVAVENGALGNDPAKIASARVDLDPSLGEIRLRYDLSRIGETAFDVGPTVNGANTFVTVGSNTSEVVFRRVHPEDWDYDGLPNDLDPDPRAPDVGAGWNQSDAWAVLAFPSNAAEIAALGYTAWATNRAAEANRRLVGFTVASTDGDWPVRLVVGGVPVLCDGKEELKFVLDCGARYPISCERGRIDAFVLHGTNDAETVVSCLQPSGVFYPYDDCVGDVTVHLDAPNRGWVCRLPDVDISLDGREVGDFGRDDGAGGIFGHFTSGSTHALMGELRPCHTNAFIDCEWSGGPGFTFATPHSLATEVTWTAVDAVAWATNFISLVTYYEGGYSLTNVVTACVGSEHVPPTGFSISCQDVLFLNDDRRPERVYPVNVTLEGTNGLSGTVTLETGGAGSKLSFDPSMDAPTNRLEFAMGVEEGDWFTSGRTVYLSCGDIGEGRIDAAIAFTNGTSCATSTTFRVIEPLRKFVTTEECKGRIVNPPRLVWGTNTILKVGMKGELDRTNVVWSVVKGPGHVFSSDGLSAEIEATATNGTVVVEARFNQDLIQPRFVLPIVKVRTFPIRAYVATHVTGEPAATLEEIRTQVSGANVYFSQAGIEFQLMSITNLEGEANVWDLAGEKTQTYHTKWQDVTLQEDTTDLENLMEIPIARDEIAVFYLGTIRSHESKRGKAGIAFCNGNRVFLPRGLDKIGPVVLAHELGHVFGLEDIYIDDKYIGQEEKQTDLIVLSDKDRPLSRSFFKSIVGDWGSEKGRGFYEKSDTLGRTIQQFLMFGVNDGVNAVGDIPDGGVQGLCVGNQERKAKVGVTTIEEKIKLGDLR